MYGFAFIIFGIIILLQAYGVFGSLSMGIVWGVAFIAVGVMIAVRRSMRRKRRAEWLMHHGSARPDAMRQGNTEKPH